MVLKNYSINLGLVQELGMNHIFFGTKKRFFQRLFISCLKDFKCSLYNSVAIEYEEEK